MKLSQN